PYVRSVVIEGPVCSRLELRYPPDCCEFDRAVDVREECRASLEVLVDHGRGQALYRNMKQYESVHSQEEAIGHPDNLIPVRAMDETFYNGPIKLDTKSGHLKLH